MQFTLMEVEPSTEPNPVAVCAPQDDRDSTHELPMRDDGMVQPPRGPFGGTYLVALGGLDPLERRMIADLDRILFAPALGAEFPEWAWGYSPVLGRCIRGKWTDSRLPLSLRRTLLANAQAEYWVLN